MATLSPVVNYYSPVKRDKFQTEMMCGVTFHQKMKQTHWIYFSVHMKNVTFVMATNVSNPIYEIRESTWDWINFPIEPTYAAVNVNAVSASMGTLSLKCQSGSNAELYMNRAHSLHGLKHDVFTVCCPSSPWSSAVSNIKCSVTQQRVHNIDDHKGYSHWCFFSGCLDGAQCSITRDHG